MEHRGDEVAREGLDPGVERPDVRVVEAPAGGDPVLDLGELALQLLEQRAGLEVRVRLGDREQLAQGPGEHVLLLGLHGRPSTRCGGGRPRSGHGLERAALVGGVPLDRRDQVGHEVVPSGQLDVDLAPRLLHQVALSDEAVVGDDERDHEQDDDAQHDPQAGHAALPPPVPPAACPGSYPWSCQTKVGTPEITLLRWSSRSSTWTEPKCPLSQDRMSGPSIRQARWGALRSSCMVRGVSTSEANLGSRLVTRNARLKSSDSSSMSWPRPMAAAKRWNIPSSVTCRLGR